MAKAVSREEANQLEKEFILEYNSIKNGYNIDKGGSPSYVYSESDKSKISDKSKSSRPNRKIPVYQYSLDGKFIRKFDSALDASYYGFSKAHICACCKGKRKEHNGFIWSYRLEKVRPYTNRCVYQFSKDMKLVSVWQSVSDILLRYDGFKRNTILNCLNNYQKSAYNYIWSYSADIKASNNLKPSYNNLIFKSLADASRLKGISTNKIRKMCIEEINGWKFE